MADEPEQDKPTLEELRDHLIPPGSNKEALWDALRQAHRTGGAVPGRFAPDISMLGRPLPPPPFPDDPVSPNDMAGIAMGEIYRSLLKGGIPLASVERIIGHWLAVMPAGQDQPGDGEG